MARGRHAGDRVIPADYRAVRRRLWAEGRHLPSRDDRGLGAGRPAALVHHDGLVARVRDGGEALQLPGQAGPAGTILQPEVASRYVVSNGGKRYTFFIRKGFRFSDGTPVTAANFKYAINRAANNELYSPARSVHHRRERHRHRRCARPSTAGPVHGCARCPSPGQQADHQLDAARRQRSCRRSRCRSSRRPRQAAARPRGRRTSAARATCRPPARTRTR